jgi:two-component system, LytTR family, response regulator
VVFGRDAAGHAEPTLSRRLDPVRFVRVHRSAIVNIESILRLEPISHGEFEVILKDGSLVAVCTCRRNEYEPVTEEP